MNTKPFWYVSSLIPVWFHFAPRRELNYCFVLFTLPDSDSDSDSEGFPFGYKLKVYTAQIQTRIPCGCTGNQSPNLSPAMWTSHLGSVCIPFPHNSRFILGSGIGRKDYFQQNVYELFHTTVHKATHYDATVRPVHTRCFTLLGYWYYTRGSAPPSANTHLIWPVSPLPLFHLLPQKKCCCRCRHTPIPAIPVRLIMERKFWTLLSRCSTRDDSEILLFKFQTR